MYTDSTIDGGFQKNPKTEVITSHIDDMDNLHIYTCKSSVPDDINNVTAKLKTE
jgi:hypothetical protein